MPRVVNIRDVRLTRDRNPSLPDGAIRIDRGSPWGNPYRLGTIQPDGSPLGRHDAIEMYRVYAEGRLRAEPDWLAPLASAEYLVCWCAPKACHGDVLVDLLSRT